MSFRNVHNTRDVLFRLCANTAPQRDSIFTKGPEYVLDHVTSEIAIGSELGTGATKTRWRRLQTPLAAANQDGRNCGQTVLLAGSQPPPDSASLLRFRDVQTNTIPCGFLELKAVCRLAPYSTRISMSASCTPVRNGKTLVAANPR